MIDFVVAAARSETPERDTEQPQCGKALLAVNQVEQGQANGNRLAVRVRDTGVGLPEGQVGRGLGTQIVRTLIQGELSGTIDWHTLMGSGTEVTIEIPMRYIERARA